MSLTFYYGSGSPFAWRVHLALEHKQIPYEAKLLSFQAGDTRKPEFLAINPRGKVPTIRDDDFVLWESGAILEYLEEKYPHSGKPLFPGDLRERAHVRRLCRESDFNVGFAMEKILGELLRKPEADWNSAMISKGREDLLKELRVIDQNLRGDFMVGQLSAADFNLYPSIALALRMEKVKKPDLALARELPARLTAWMKRIEALPYYDKTYPPHWR